MGDKVLDMDVASSLAPKAWRLETRPEGTGSDEMCRRTLGSPVKAYWNDWD